MACQIPFNYLVKTQQIRFVKYQIKLSLILVVFFSNLSCQRPILEVDYLIQGALVYNGENQEPPYTDVGILGDKLVIVGGASSFSISAGWTIDATILYLSPGFIDPHTHFRRGAWTGRYFL